MAIVAHVSNVAHEPFVFFNVTNQLRCGGFHIDTVKLHTYSSVSIHLLDVYEVAEREKITNNFHLSEIQNKCTLY